MTLTSRLVAATIAVAVVGVGGAIVLRPGAPGVAATPSPVAPSGSPVNSPTPSASARASAALDYSTLSGRILMEHLGNAPDLSEMPTGDYHADRRRLYFMDPATMTGQTASEFLPGQPTTGKLDADVATDGSKIVFMDTAVPAQIWIANADGTGLRKLSQSCACSELDPAFDPTGAKVVLVHVEGAVRNSVNGANLGYQWDGHTPVTSWLAIRDLATGKVTKVATTSKTGPDGLPYQPAWSPDGAEIVFNRTTWETGGNPTGTLQVVNIATGSVRTLSTTNPSSTAPDATSPGDADWSPDGSTILFTDFPWSEMGSIAGLPGPSIFAIHPDGTGMTRVAGGTGASFMSDGRIVFQSGRSEGGGYFWIMNADGSAAAPVNRAGASLTDLPQGFAYIPHWVPAGP